MERRSFLKGLGAIVGGLALNEAVPLGRVYSFPSVISISDRQWRAHGRVWTAESVSFDPEAFALTGSVGSLHAIRIPRRYDVPWSYGQLSGEVGQLYRVEYDEEINLLRSA